MRPALVTVKLGRREEPIPPTEHRAKTARKRQAVQRFADRVEVHREQQAGLVAGGGL